MGRPDAHDLGRHPDTVPGREAPERGEPPALRLRGGHQHQGGGTVVDARGIAGGHQAVRLEDRLQGAKLVEVPAVPYANPNNYVKISGRLAERLAKEEAAGAVWANQFDNIANRQAHIETTGPEIFDELNGEVDGFVCACGTGGTLAGVGMALKSRNPEIPQLRNRNQGLNEVNTTNDGSFGSAPASRIVRCSADG